MVAFDVVQRWLKASGYRVTYVRNVTDIDDKIIRRALENKETIGALTDRMVALLHRDADALGVERPDHEPRATQYVGQMLGLIERLEQRGCGPHIADLLAANGITSAENLAQLDDASLALVIDDPQERAKVEEVARTATLLRGSAQV
jgi:cysteinyl-tRNA synthetase